MRTVGDPSAVDEPPGDGGFVSLAPSGTPCEVAKLWESVRPAATGEAAEHPTAATPAGSVLEAGISVIAELVEAPPRTLHSAPLIRSSPLPPAVRAMLETREFGRSWQAVPLDLEPIRDRLPGLECPGGPVAFLACDPSFETLNRSVDGLLQHRTRLLEPGIHRELPRKNVLIVGAGPGGLMTAVQLAMRGHQVLVCEQREGYERNRYIGVYKEVTHLMAALGMPESMTYDFSQYRGKRGIMLADIQTFLHGIALKLGVIIYTGAVVRDLDAEGIRHGELVLQRAARSAAATEPSSIGMTRWHYDSVARVRSGVTVRFDTIVEASGGRSGLRELLVGPENVVSLHTLGLAAASRDPSLTSFFEDPDDHCAEFVESGYACPPGLRESFAEALLSGSREQIPDELPCFVSNIDADIISRPMQASPGSAGLASRIGDRELAIPHDWVVLECRLSDQSLSRYHIEGPLPQTFEFGGQRLSTRDALKSIKPLSLLLRILYAMGMPFDAVDRRQLIEFYASESSQTDASDIVATWVGRFRGLRLGGEPPLWCGTVPGSDSIGYGIVGEALQNAWYRFGVGVDDTFVAACRFAEGLDLPPAARLEEARRLEKVMTARSVQVLYHLYGVARNTDQGVVGSVLTEYHMDQKHAEDLADASLRQAAREGAEMLATEGDLQARRLDVLLASAFEHQRDQCCRRLLDLLGSFPYPPDLLARAREALRETGPEARRRSFDALAPKLSEFHRELVAPVFAQATPRVQDEDQRRRVHDERLAELGMGRYAWAGPWLRACALRALDSAAAGTGTVLAASAADPNPLVAETAAAALAGQSPAAGNSSPARDRYSTIDKVLVLREVGLFKAIPDQDLAGLASLLTERWTAPQERIVTKGEIGDCLYVVASGRVRVHDGDLTYRQLGASECFGELALLDSQPRSASVSAVEPCHLFRLSQNDFYALMGERPGIAQAINRVLCGMVRSANEAREAARTSQPVLQPS